MKFMKGGKLIANSNSCQWFTIENKSTFGTTDISEFKNFEN